MQTESQPGQEGDKSRLNENERRELKERIRGGKAVLDEIEQMLAGDGIDLSELTSIESHILEIEEDLRKLKQKGGKSHDEAQRIVRNIRQRANLQ